jgi:hypothetical protein
LVRIDRCVSWLSGDSNPHVSLESSPGKTPATFLGRSVLDGVACWIEGNATLFGMYVTLYKHPDHIVVIDDFAAGFFFDDGTEEAGF